MKYNNQTIIQDFKNHIKEHLKYLNECDKKLAKNYLLSIFNIKRKHKKITKKEEKELINALNDVFLEIKGLK